MFGAIADCWKDSFSEIKQLLKQKAPHLRKVVRSTQSLRHSYPLIDVAESIYNEADRASVQSESDPMIASSELDFDFDDIVVDSAAYRRVLTKYQAAHLRQNEALEDLIDFSDNATMRQASTDLSVPEFPRSNEDLAGLRFTVDVRCKSLLSLQIIIICRLQRY